MKTAWEGTGWMPGTAASHFTEDSLKGLSSELQFKKFHFTELTGVEHVICPIDVPLNG